ncbi:meiosis-specific protein MEI4-like [Antedon mediterranea]|uniref:meiosis-specific protein MEI4-like n=1 Tax=Antedon mediterranea TaxID=105859 RepID=UPI003AF5D67F
MDMPTSINPNDLNYIKRVKLAVAVAVVKNKPNDMPAEEYAKELRETIHNRERSWKIEAKRLKTELLTAKQELFRVKAEEKIKSNKSDDGNEIMASTLDNFLTPPCSSEALVRDDDDEVSQEFNRNIRFLHYTTCLHNHNKSCPFFQTKEALDILESSLNSVVDHLLENIESIPSKDVNWGIEGVLHVIDSKSNDDGEKNLERNCWRLVQGLLKRALIGAHYRPCQLQQSIIAQVVRLCQVKSLLIPTLKLLTHQIVKLSEMLRQHTNKQCELNTAQYENGCNAFEILEELLSLSETWQHIKGDVAETIKEQLESSLLHISNTFPLFAHYVWKLNSYMNKE